MNLCIPYLSVEKVLDKLVVQYWFKTDESELEDEAREKLKGFRPCKSEYAC